MARNTWQDMCPVPDRACRRVGLGHIKEIRITGAPRMQA